MDKREKWLWIELIGFELEAADLGVGEYLGRLGFTPSGLSLLITSPNFVHLHDANWAERVFPPEYCSYGAHGVNGERRRQVWTGAKLKQLVDELHKHGVEVCFAVFDFCQQPEWLEQHPEIYYTKKNGEQVGYVCAWKRLADGSFYEDFFVEKLAETLRDYGFDGYHAGDGYAHPRLPIYEGDFSNDMIEQFVGSSGLQIPVGFFDSGTNSKEQTRRVAEWILREQQSAWRKFYTQRITGFWAKVVRKLKSMDKWMIYNSAWTRDPFEAIYRYGVDYRALCEVGVDKYIVELAGAVLELENWGPQEPRPLYSRMASTLLFRAYVPDAKLVFLNGIRDFNEQYLLLHHAPSLFETEVISQYNLFHRATNGELRRCQDGVLACLADGLTKAEWEKINRTWDFSAEFQPEAVDGAVLLHSGKHLPEQLDQYMKDRHWYEYRLLTHLLSAGAPLHTVADVGDVDKLGQPLVVLNPELWDAAELAQVAAYRKAPVICVGYDTGKMPFDFDLVVKESQGAGSLYCGVFNGKDMAAPERPPRQGDTLPTTIEDPGSWLNDLYVHGVAADFLPLCAKLISGCSRSSPFQRVPAETKIETLRNGDVCRLIVWNDQKHYAHVTIKPDAAAEAVEYVSGFTNCEIHWHDNAFRLKLPPSGMTIADLTFPRKAEKVK